MGTVNRALIVAIGMLHAGAPVPCWHRVAAYELRWWRGSVFTRRAGAGVGADRRAAQT